ncbi:MAG: hypothetical protein ACF788_08435 [Novipirellula sp. JB048]
MSTKEQRRQKKLAKKRSKEVAKRKEMAREKNSLRSLTGQMKAASGGPVDQCLMSARLFDPDAKFGSVYLSRRMRDGRLAVIKLMVDGFCLGVKNVVAFVCFPADQSRILEDISQAEPMQAVSPAKARKFVEGAIAFAQQFKIDPAADYRKVAPIWGDIDPRECEEEFAFGDHEGKPRFVNGPYDSLHFQQQVCEKLHTHAGEGQYEVIRMMSSDELDLDDSDERGDWVDDPELDADIDEDVVDGRAVPRSD